MEFLTLRNGALNNCKLICEAMQQDTNLHMEKFKRIVKDVEAKTTNMAYIDSLEFYRRVYNESVYRLNSVQKKYMFSDNEQQK